MKQSAARMILSMMAVAVLITVISGDPLPLVVMAAVGYTTWLVAKGFDG